MLSVSREVLAAAFVDDDGDSRENRLGGIGNYPGDGTAIALRHKRRNKDQRNRAEPQMDLPGCCGAHFNSPVRSILTR